MIEKQINLENKHQYLQKNKEAKPLYKEAIDANESKKLLEINNKVLERIDTLLKTNKDDPNKQQRLMGLKEDMEMFIPLL